MKSVIVGLAILLSWPAQSDCLIRLPVSGERPPFYQLRQQQWQGQSIEWLQAVAHQLNCRTKIIELPWGRSLKMLMDGELEMMTNLSMTGERQSTLTFIGPHATERMMLLLLKSQPKLQHVTQLTQLSKPIAVLAKGYYGADFSKLEPELNLKEKLLKLQSSEQLQALASSGRIAGLMEDEQLIKYWFRTGLLDESAYQPMLLVHQNPVYLAFSKKQFSDSQLQHLQLWWQKLSSASTQFGEHTLTPLD